MATEGVLDPDDEYADTSIFENKAGLSDDMRFLASMPELCDVTFLVGETREPVCAVKAVLGARSRVFQKMLYPSAHSNASTQGSKESSAKDPTMKAASKLKAFIKRSSEPLLNMEPKQPTSDLHHQTLIIEEFEPDVFRQLIEYAHTGCVTLQPRTLLGVMNAADYYGLDELKRACSGFIQCCVNVDTVCALLATAERYIQYKCTKSVVQRVLEFVDEHGNEVLNLGSFALLPQHVVRLILARDELRADEFSKFQAALMWSKKYCDSTNGNIADTLGSFLEFINFHMIPANVLMKEIHPLGLVPYHIIMNALAYQADPTSVEGPGNIAVNAPPEPPLSGRRQTVRARGRTGGSSSLSSNNRSMSVQGCGTGANLLPDPNSSEIGNVHGGGGGGGSSFGGSNTTLSSSASSANIIVTGVDGGGGGVGGGMGMGGRRSATPSSLSAVAVVQPDGSSTHSAQSKASTESLQ